MVLLVIVGVCALVVVVILVIPRLWGTRAAAGTIACDDLSQAEVAAAIGAPALPGQRDQVETDPRANNVCRFGVPSSQGSVSLYVKWTYAGARLQTAATSSASRQPITRPGFTGFTDMSGSTRGTYLVHDGHFFEVWLGPMGDQVRSDATERLAELAAEHAGGD